MTVATTSPVPLVSFVGTSKSGKTTFIEKLIPILRQTGLRIAVIKHHHLDFEIDIAGKDTYRHKQAGASTVILSSPHKIALVKDLGEEMPLQEIMSRYVDEVDLIIVEGYKKEHIPRIEVFGYGKEAFPLASRDRTILAIITDNVTDLTIPRFAFDDVDGVARFVLSRIMKRERFQS